MKIKKYNDRVYDELVKCLYKNVEGGNCVFSLIRSLERAAEKYPDIKNYFIHDMNAWLSRWFYLCEDCSGCSIKLQSKILTTKFALDCSDFNNINIVFTDFFLNI